jgi:uncharacterized protein YegP (UPF0339 family)
MGTVKNIRVKAKKAKRPDTIKAKRSRNGKYYYTRHAPNGEKIDRSQMYESRSGRNKAVNRIAEKEMVIIERSR